MSLKVIVSGAGVAGLALAQWLDRIGGTTIIVERAPRFQALGHYISLKGNGVEMGCVASSSRWRRARRGRLKPVTNF